MHFLLDVSHCERVAMMNTLNEKEEEEKEEEGKEKEARNRLTLSLRLSTLSLVKAKQTSCLHICEERKRNRKN